MTAEKLRAIYDGILANKDLQPEDTDGDGTLDKTKCNLAAQIAAEEYGYEGFLVREGKKARGLMANEMMALFESESRKHQAWLDWHGKKEGAEPERGDWVECHDGKNALGAADMGLLVFAACYGAPEKVGNKIVRGHGHIAGIYPSGGCMAWSGKWSKEVPYVANVGRKIGKMSANYAFLEEPRYFIFIRDVEIGLVQPA